MLAARHQTSVLPPLLTPGSRLRAPGMSARSPPYWRAPPVHTHATVATSRSAVRPSSSPPGAAGSCPPTRSVRLGRPSLAPLLPDIPPLLPPRYSHPQRPRAAERAAVPLGLRGRSSKQSPPAASDGERAGRVLHLRG